MAEEEGKRIVPRLQKPEGSFVEYPAQPSDVANALGITQTSNLHDLAEKAGVTPCRTRRRKIEAREYMAEDVANLLKWMQQQPPVNLRIGPELVSRPKYPGLDGKDLTKAGTVLSMGFNRRIPGGWQIVLREE